MANAKAETPKTVEQVQALKEQNRKLLAEGKRDANQFVSVDQELDRQLAEAIAREAHASVGTGDLKVTASQWTPKGETESKPMVRVEGAGKPFNKGAGFYRAILSEAGLVGIHKALSELGFTTDVAGMEKALKAIKAS